MTEDRAGWPSKAAPAAGMAAGSPQTAALDGDSWGDPMTDPTMNRDQPRGRVLAAGALCVAIGVLAAASFLPRQSIWNDEATQLFGLTLSPASQARWLAGVEHHDFGVPDDRMPPLSYWSGWAWAQVFGPGEAAMRSLGVVAVALATALVFAAGTRAWGLPAGIAAALLLGASPNVVVTAVEIRAYPLFVLSSAGLFYCLIRLLDDAPERGSRWLAGMAACAIAGAYLHFFGLVAAGGAFLAALIVVPRRGGRIVPVLAACAAVGVACCGLLPFVSAAREVGKPTVNAGEAAGPAPALRSVSPRDVVKLFYRLFFHASMRLHVVSTVAGMLGVGLASLACLFPASRGRDASLGMWIAWVSGTMVVLAASLVAPIETLAVRYNVWMYPATALILASSLSARHPAVRWAATAGAASLVAAMLWGDFILSTRGEIFAHTSVTLVDEEVRRLGTDRVAVIFDETNDKDPWGLYSPLRYLYRGELRQFAFVRSDGDRLEVREYPNGKVPIDVSALGADYLIVVRCGFLDSDGLLTQYRGGVQEFGDGPVARHLKATAGWTLRGERHRLSYYPAEIDVFERKPASAR